MEARDKPSIDFGIGLAMFATKGSGIEVKAKGESLGYISTDELQHALTLLQSKCPCCGALVK